MAKRTPRATSQQFEAMVNFMTDHPYLVHAKLSATLPITERDSLWQELTSILNNETFGPKKTTHQWRRAWTDLKSEVKDKLAEQEQKRQSGNKQEILNPCHRKIAKLLARAYTECSLVEARSLTAQVSERKKEIGVKNEENGILLNDSSTPAPFVVSIVSLRNQEPVNESIDFVKCEQSAVNYSSDSEVVVPYAHTENSNDGYQSPVEVPACPTMPSSECQLDQSEPRPKRKRRRKNDIEDKNLNSLVQVETKKADRLHSIANAIYASNETDKRRLKVEEERNRLLQERNGIERERNKIFQSLLELLQTKQLV